jgi:hypothetical protein
MMGQVPIQAVASSVLSNVYKFVGISRQATVRLRIAMLKGRLA